MESSSILVLSVAVLTIFSSTFQCITGEVNIFQLESDQFVGTDKSSSVFGTDDNDIFPVAYVDLNADKLTDMITVSRNRTSLSIFFAFNEPPYLRRVANSENVAEFSKNKRIVSVRPGDFTGDGILDLMITLKEDFEFEDESDHGQQGEVEVIFCLLRFETGLENAKIVCPGPGGNSSLHLVQEPMVLDLNGDMVLDLLGEKWVRHQIAPNRTTWRKQRTVWYSSSNSLQSFEWRSEQFKVSTPEYDIYDMLKVSSNLYGDLDGDNEPELVIISESFDSETKLHSNYVMETFIVHQNGKAVFHFKNLPKRFNFTDNEPKVLGQPIIMDIDHDGNVEYLVPYCSDVECRNSGIYLINNGVALPLPMDVFVNDDLKWSFVPPAQEPSKTGSTERGKSSKMASFYSRSLVLRVGDYNLDGYPDLLAVLTAPAGHKDKQQTRAVMLENVPCVSMKKYSCPSPRTFKDNFAIFKEYQNVISASFYDIKDNGVLDVFIVLEQPEDSQQFSIRALENDMNFDSSFLKFIVLTGQGCRQCRGDISYGNVLPGPTIRYSSLSSKGELATGIMIQAYRTSHVTLDLPCGLFGIGHSPNFIESFSVAVWNPKIGEVHQKMWHQIIPNSQIVVEPRPLQKTHLWTMKLFLTPSDAVLNTFSVLVGICLVLGTFVALLEFKERQEDRKARICEASQLFM